MISGSSMSPGIAFGKPLILRESNISISKVKISDDQIEKEVLKFFSARHKTIKQLKIIKDMTKNSIGESKSEIFEGHIMLVEDDEFEKSVIEIIEKEKKTAESAIKKAINKQIKSIEKIDNTYLRERALDFKDIGTRMLKNVLGIPIINLGSIDNRSILVAKDISPSEISQLNLKKILGLIIEFGGKASHSFIIAKSLEIPSIFGVKDAINKIQKCSYIILDALNNKIYCNPSEMEIKKAKKIQHKHLKIKKSLENLKNFPAITIDGHRIKLCANVNGIHDIQITKSQSADGIGLYRTEFLYMNRNSFPCEEEQFETYKKIAVSINPNPITIRTIDIGGDKTTSCIEFPKEENPFLGWRAIRVSMDRKEILHTQIRAILRASNFGKIYIMFPMIISIEEILYLKEEILFIKKQLKKKKYEFDPSIKIGVMIETPAAAVISRDLAKEVDFFSIGTNDLTQYTLAVDRNNEKISHLYNPISPSVLRLIKKVISNSHKEGKWTGICGEIAGDETYSALLLGMGVDELSMSSSSIQKVKRIIRNVSYRDAKKLAEKSIKKSKIKEIEKTTISFLLKRNLIKKTSHSKNSL
ncbi:phosphoenolpyruvate-protein phosphotransferase [Candidatus Riesia sp. GBBU]|nr:phosphoenolpyruvate-protein phosphotransferase [Candidatus Riesia sp. GBBU]ARC55063.1 phosphoenolpyruvate-protein phosphotransferase [Candidatus Riesia sp. GBBU]